jgi:pilus assembly protein CpaB
MRKIALLAAIIMGLASLAFLAKYKSDFESRVSGGESVPVLVASSSIDLGEVLTEDMLAIREIPESYVDARHIRASEVDKAIGIRTTMGLRADEAILWTDLSVASQERRVLSGLVKEGMRAVTVRIQQGRGLSGLLRPGDRIDLLLRATREAGPIVMPLLQNVLVLAVGSDMGSQHAPGEDNVIDMVMGASDLTLSVTIQQAQVLTLAEGEGSLSASLSNPNDILVERNSPVVTAENIHLAAKRDEMQVRRTRKPAAEDTTTREIEHVD